MITFRLRSLIFLINIATVLDKSMKGKSLTLLLVDDEPDILEIITYNLEKEGFAVHTAKNGREALKRALKYRPQLILMDIMMPEMDGIEACEQIRRHKELADTLVVFLSARGEDFSQMAAFDAGGDDYITKPIKPKVLVKKIKALLKRIGRENNDSLEVGNLTIDRERYTVTQDGQTIALPRKEFELLTLLASKPEKVFKRDEILEKVWGKEVVVGSRTIDVHIRKLREKLGSGLLHTVKGVGYKFEIKL